MKTFSLTTVMLLTVVFAHPASAGDKAILFKTDSGQPARQDGNIGVSSSGHGFLTLDQMERDTRKVRFRAAQRQEFSREAKTEIENRKTTDYGADRPLRKPGAPELSGPLVTRKK